MKIWNYVLINLSSTFNFYGKILFRCNNIHREIDQWNRRRLGAKWNVTVPSSVTQIKPIVCKWIYMSQRWYCQMTYELHIYEVRDLFPWEMITKMVISCLLNVEKIWNSAQINLSSTLNFLKKILFRRNNIHREIDHWNRCWFDAK